MNAVQVTSREYTDEKDFVPYFEINVRINREAFQDLRALHGKAVAIETIFDVIKEVDRLLYEKFITEPST